MTRKERDEHLHYHRRVYSGAPHGLAGDYETAFNTDLLAFLNG